MFVQEAGVHFCSFTLMKEPHSNNALANTIGKENLSSLIGRWQRIKKRKSNICARSEGVRRYLELAMGSAATGRNLSGPIAAWYDCCIKIGK